MTPKITKAEYEVEAEAWRVIARAFITPEHYGSKHRIAGRVNGALCTGLCAAILAVHMPFAVENRMGRRARGAFPRARTGFWWPCTLAGSIARAKFALDRAARCDKLAGSK